MRWFINVYQELFESIDRSTTTKTTKKKFQFIRPFKSSIKSRLILNHLLLLSYHHHHHPNDQNKIFLVCLTIFHILLKWIDLNRSVLCLFFFSFFRRVYMTEESIPIYVLLQPQARVAGSCEKRETDRQNITFVIVVVFVIDPHTYLTRILSFFLLFRI